jgi:myo-inositol 2-dehydrogenase / D-chiro-inositol 1-dehydrogenase
VTLRIGIVGAGMMGAAHARMLAGDVPGCRVTEVYDADAARAQSVATSVQANPAGSAEGLVDGDEVDAVVVASPDSTHASLVVRCLMRAKPVLCEKPLSLTSDESAALVQQETGMGRRLVQVGFMRRYDPGFVELRDTLRRGDLGTVRLLHCVHRNVMSVTSTSSVNLITGSMIHELDQVRWLLGEDIASIELRSPVQNGFQDPQLATIEMRSGTLVTVEVFVNAAYGYDVRCEAVGTKGTATVEAAPAVRVRRDGIDAGAVPADFVVRFGEAYRRELTDWVEAASAGTARGASVWDGHLANVAAAAGVDALTTGQRVEVPRLEAPGLYRREFPQESR